MSENENAEPVKVEAALLSEGNVIPDIDLRSVRTPEELGLIVKEVETEVQEELKAEVVEGNGVSEEPKELTDEEKHEIFIEQLKASKIKFKPVKHFAVKNTMVLTEELDVLGRKKKRKDTTILTNVTTNPYGTAYKKERRRKNKQQKASRKANR